MMSSWLMERSLYVVTGFIAALGMVFNVYANPTLSFEPLEEQKIKSHFVNNTQCINCHGEQAKEWEKSHHAQAMMPSSEKAVKGDFNNTTFKHHDVTSTFFRTGDDFFVNTIGPDGELDDFKIQYTFGIEPLQQYVIELEKGRFQTLDIAWDTRNKEEGGQRWFRLNPDEETKAGDALHWTGRAYNWNNRCAECHSTNVKKNYDLASDSYSTTWSEINVSCQSCHGPGEKHLAWTELSDTNKELQNDKGLLVNTLMSTASEKIDTCARCHSRRHQVSVDNTLGAKFLDEYLPATLSEGLYHADGQIDDEVFVYGSFLQSKMHEKGVGCLDCHTPHSGQLKLTGNSLCLQCHTSSPPKQRFSSLQEKNYDSPEHHFHKQDSVGAQCVNCHMPAKTYMEVDARRDHSFKIPSPLLSQQINTPNACNSCHQDKLTQWAIDKMTQWYGDKTITDSQKTAEVIYNARHGDSHAWQGLVDIINNPDTRPIITATALEQLVNYFPRREAVEATVSSLQHSDPLVRSTAAGTLEQLPLRHRIPLATPLLDDTSRSVRIQAARVVGGVHEAVFAENKESFTTALQEYVDLQNSLADTPEAHINLGVLYTSQEKFNLAEKEYKHAIRLAPEFVPSYVNLANLYNRLDRNQEAEDQFRQAIILSPDNGELYYSLGLLLAEQQRYSEALLELAKAKELLPQRRRVAYNYALALQHLGQYSSAEAVFKQMLSTSPDDADITYALITLYAQQQKWQDALPYAKSLVELTNGAQEPTKIYQEIQSMAIRQ